MKSIAVDGAFRERWRRLSLLHRVVLLCQLAGSALVFWTMFFGRNFFVAPGYFRVLVWPAAVAAILVGLGWVRLMPVLVAQPGYYGERIRRFGAFTKYFLIPALMGGIFTFFPLMNAVPSLLHKAAGSAFSETYTVAARSYESSGRGACNRIYVQELDEYWFGKLCVSDRALADLAASDAIVLSGTRSWFGVDVARYAY